MARRRMIAPNFWKDPEVAKLTIPERLLFIGIVSNADDEGRIIATPEALKADIFPYDHKITARVVKRMRDSLVNKMKNVLLYENDNVEYIVLLRWGDHQKPSHATASKLPPPSQFRDPCQVQEVQESIAEPFTERCKEPFTEPSKESINESLAPSLGQSSQGENSLVKRSLANRNYNFKHKSASDLTDYLTTLLEENIPRGPGWGADVMMEFWKQCIGEPDSTILQGAHNAIKHYSPKVIAEALIKSKTYGAGKHHTWKYVEEILKEKANKGVG